MIERRQELGFTVEAGDAIGVDGKGGGQHLDGDVAIQLRVARAIDLAHPARADRGNDRVRPEPASGRDPQGRLNHTAGLSSRTLCFFPHYPKTIDAVNEAFSVKGWIRFCCRSLR